MICMCRDVSDMHLPFIFVFRGYHSCYTVWIYFPRWSMFSCLPCLTFFTVFLLFTTSATNIGNSMCCSCSKEMYQDTECNGQCILEVVTCIFITAFSFSLWLHKTGVCVRLFFFLLRGEGSPAGKLFGLNNCYNQSHVFTFIIMCITPCCIVTYCFFVLFWSVELGNLRDSVMNCT